MAAIDLHPTASSATPGYRIGTVAGLTGLDPHTIRAWERRHRAVEPGRTQRGTRLYDDAAIERLQLLKALVDCGEPIRRIAPLATEELRERLVHIAGLQRGGSPAIAGRAAEPVEVAMLAPALGEQIDAGAGRLEGFRVVVRSDRHAGFVEELRRTPCDLMLLHMDELGKEPLRALDACLVASEAELVVVVYTFARRGVLTRLARRGARLVRGPLDTDHLRRALTDLVAADRATHARRRPPERPARVEVQVDGAVPRPRQFDDARLARIAEVSTAIECECPQHLSSLVRSLVAFEAYSAGCESRDSEDAAMHRRLAQQTGEARRVMEDLLVALCEYEGIEV